ALRETMPEPVYRAARWERDSGVGGDTFDEAPHRVGCHLPTIVAVRCPAEQIPTVARTTPKQHVADEHNGTGWLPEDRAPPVPFREHLVPALAEVDVRIRQPAPLADAHAGLVQQQDDRPGTRAPVLEAG